MSDWLTLGDVVTLQRGTTYLSRRLGEPGPVLLGLGAIQRHGGFKRGEVKTYGGESAEKLLLRPGDLFLSLKDVTQDAALLGAVARVPNSVKVGRLTQDTVKLTIASPDIDANYLYWILRTPQYREYCRQHAIGTTNLSLSREDFLSYPLPPATAPRVKLINLLEAIESKISVNDHIATTVDQYCAALFESIIARNSDRTIELGEIADVNTKSVKPNVGGSLRYVDIASVGDGRLTWPTLTSWDEAPGRARRGISVGDTIWSTVRPNRRSRALVLDEDSLLVASTGFAVITPRGVGPAFLYESARREEFVAYLESVAEGSAYPAVRAERFLAAPILTARDEHRDRFEALALQARLRAHAAVRENRVLAELRDTLLPELMTGRLRVKGAEEVVELAV